MFERGYLCSSAVAYVVARCSRTTIVDVLPYKASVESKRRERDGSSAGSASVGGLRRVELCWLVLLFVCCLHFSARTSLDRAAEGGSPRWRSPPFVVWLQLWQCEGCYFVWGNVIEVEELRQKNRRELLLEEEQGFPRRLVLLCLL